MLVHLKRTGGLSLGWILAAFSRISESSEYGQGSGQDSAPQTSSVLKRKKSSVPALENPPGRYSVFPITRCCLFFLALSSSPCTTVIKSAEKCNIRSFS